MLTPDWWCGKDYAVLKAVDVFGAVKDRRALHRILYFANLKTGTFAYQWYRHGPFSPELVYKIADHVWDKSLDEGGRGGMRLSEAGRRMLQNGAYPAIDSALGWVRGLLGGMKPGKMELMASAHYLVWCGHEPGEVRGILQKTRPGSFTEGDVAGALQFLEDGGLLGQKAGV